MVFLKIMKTFACVILLLCSEVLYSQNKEQRLESLYNDFNRTSKNKTDSALIYIKEAHKIALALNNENDWLAKTFYGLGYCYYLKREDSISLLYTRKAIQHAKKANNHDILSKGYSQVGQLYSLQNNYPKALKELYKSIEISEKYKELYDNTIITLTFIGDILVTEKDTTHALAYYHRAKSIGKIKKSLKLDRVYNNLGVLYMGTEKDSALFYFENAINLYVKNENLYGEVSSRTNLAVTILNFSDSDKYPEAYKQLQISIKLSKVLKNPDLLFFSYYFLGAYYEKVVRDNSKAQSYYKESIKLLKNGYKNEYTIQLYKSLSRIAMKQGDYKTAFEFQSKFQQLQDSVFSVEKNKQFHEIQTKFDVERKNNKIQLLNKKNEQQKWILAGASVLMTLLLLIVYLARKKAINQKIIREKELLLFEKEKEFIYQNQKLNEINFLVEGQDRERKRISRELHDGIGSTIAAINMNLFILNQNEVKNNRLNLQIEQLNNVSKEIRVISHALRIGVDSNKTLLELINNLIKIYRLDRKLQVRLTIFPENCLDDLDDFLKMNLYRIFQEVFANISKHANANKVEISVAFHDDEFSIMIEDDGIGFDMEEYKGIGIKNIIERVKELKGGVNIDSAKKHGTTICMQIPKTQLK